MATVTILHSDTAGHIPTGLLAPGRIAINEADGILFWLDADGATIRSFNFKNPIAPTQANTDNSVKVATTAFVQAVVAALDAAIIGGADAAFQTFHAIENALGGDAALASTLNTALANRIRFDAVQALTTAQKTQLAANIGLAAVALSGSYLDLSNTPTIEPVASSADFMALTGGKAIDTSAVSGAVSHVAYGNVSGNFTPNFTQFINGSITLTGNVVIKTPAAYQPASTWHTIMFTQDGTGGRTISFDAGAYVFDSGVVPAIDTAPTRQTRLSFLVRGTFVETYMIGKGMR